MLLVHDDQALFGTSIVSLLPSWLQVDYKKLFCRLDRFDSITITAMIGYAGPRNFKAFDDKLVYFSDDAMMAWSGDDD
jgi:hypothetical protein